MPDLINTQDVPDNGCMKQSPDGSDTSYSRSLPDKPGVDSLKHSQDEPIRLQKLLAGSGVGSRRYCESLIREGRISIDGVSVTEMGAKARPSSIVAVDGVPISPALRGYNNTDFIYILLNKPPGIISSAKDQFGRKTVVDLVGGADGKRVYPVGRLDYHTGGLIILTDDGDFAYRATHPKFRVDKEYEVICDRPPEPGEIARLRDGVVLPDGFRTSPARVRRDDKHANTIYITLHEGKYRQVRRMAQAVGLNVRGLRRLSVGRLDLGPLKEGEWRIISRVEAELVFAQPDC